MIVLSNRFFIGFILFILFSALMSTGCSTSRNLPGKVANTVEEIWDSIGLEQESHSGLVIYDPSKKAFIFDKKGDHQYTPASNVKILTMLTTLEALDEDIPALYYQTRKDTLIIWGGGDPGTFYPDIHRDAPWIDFLRNSGKTIVFSNHHFQTDRYGKGWSWDDFPYNFQTERTALPAYGNQLWTEHYHDTVLITPSYYKLMVSIHKDTIEKIWRNEWGTTFTFQYNPSTAFSSHSVPASLLENDIRSIWQGITGLPIVFDDIPFQKGLQWIKGSSRDSLLKSMMKLSDNHIADQLLLASSLSLHDVMNEKIMIDQMISSLSSTWNRRNIWVDGSGLSRYNQISPRTFIHVLDKLYSSYSMTYLESIFPAGGISGTIKNNFHSPVGTPYVFAKSGRMSGVYCLSGYLKTNNGKVLIFSWLNNHISSDDGEMELKMEKLFSFLRDHYQ